MTVQAIASRLGKDGLCICPDFLPARHWFQTRHDLDVLRTSGGFEKAGTGKGDSHRGAGLIRGDETHWLNSSAGTPALLPLWRRIEALKTALNRTLFMGLTKFDGHYAIYPKGTGYVRHLDNVKGSNRRMVSFILYLNRNWSGPDGGQLRVFDDEQGHQDIDPVGGTMVCFLSRESEHQVLQSHSDRFSFAGWFST